MRFSSSFVAIIVTVPLSSASWQGIWCNISNLLSKINTPCPALNFPYLTLPLSPSLSLPPSPDSGFLALTSVTQIETKKTKLGKLVDFVGSLFPSRRTVNGSAKCVDLFEPSDPLLLSENPTIPFVAESYPAPFFTTNSKHYTFSEFESCQRNDFDSFSFNSVGLPTCSLNVMRSLDVCLSYSSVFKSRIRFSTTSCYASICTRKLEEELLKELFECHDGALAYVGGTLDCKRSERENSKQPEKNLEIDGALIVQNRSVNGLHPKISCGIVERSCKPSRNLELSSDSDLKIGVAIEAWFKFLVDSILCNQGSTISSSKSVNDFRSLQENHQTYWEQLTPFQKEQAIIMIESYFNKPQTLDLGSAEYEINAPTFFTVLAAIVAVFTATIVTLARSALRTNADDTVFEKPSSKHEAIDQQPEAVETDESEVVTEESEVVTEESEVVTEESEVVTEESEVVTEESEVVTANASKEETVKSSSQEPLGPVETPKEAFSDESVKVLIEAFERLQRDSREFMKEFKKEVLDVFLDVKSQEPEQTLNDQAKEVSNEQPKKESEEELQLKKEAEKRKKKYQKKRDKKREKKLLKQKESEVTSEEPSSGESEASKIELQEEPNEKPAETSIEERMVTSIEEPKEGADEASLEKIPKSSEALHEASEEESNEEPLKESNDMPSATSIEEVSLEQPYQESVEEFIEYLKSKRETEKRKLKNQKKGLKKREKRMQKIQAKKEPQNASEIDLNDAPSPKPQDAPRVNSKDASSEETNVESPKDTRTMSEAEKRKIKNQKKNKKSREKRKQKKLQAMKEAEEASNQKPREAPKEYSKDTSKDTPSEEPKEESPKDIRTMSEAEKRHLKSQKKNKKMREKRKQKKLQELKERRLQDKIPK